MLKRRALLYDEPPGRSVIQHEALALIEQRPPSATGWWRFEGSSLIDCVIATDRLVITVEGKRNEPTSPATDWYPQRSQLVRNLEAASQLADGRAWGTLLLTEEALANVTTSSTLTSASSPGSKAATRSASPSHELSATTADL